MGDNISSPAVVVWEMCDYRTFSKGEEDETAVSAKVPVDELQRVEGKIGLAVSGKPGGHSRYHDCDM